jgi:hypothetical protein
MALVDRPFATTPGVGDPALTRTVAARAAPCHAPHAVTNANPRPARLKKPFAVVRIIRLPQLKSLTTYSGSLQPTNRLLAFVPLQAVWCFAVAFLATRHRAGHERRAAAW